MSEHIYRMFLCKIVESKFCTYSWNYVHFAEMVDWKAQILGQQKCNHTKESSQVTRKRRDVDEKQKFQLATILLLVAFDIVILLFLGRYT